MSFLLNLIPGVGALKLWALGIAAAAAVAFVGYEVHHQREVGRAEVKQAWDASVSLQRAAALAEAEANAKETKRRIERQGDAQHATDQAIFAATNDAATARVSADSLRQWADQRVAAAESRPASNPATGSDCTTAADSARVLADVLRKSDERSGVLAEYADRARIAGQQCVSDYDALK